jgi:hypothetical protein
MVQAERENPSAKPLPTQAARGLQSPILLRLRVRSSVGDLEAWSEEHLAGFSQPMLRFWDPSGAGSRGT